MLKLLNLNQSITSLDGSKIRDIRDKADLTFKSALITICETHRPKEPGSGESLRIFDLGIRIQKAKEEIELQEEEISFLLKIINENGVYVAVVIGRLNYYLKEALPKVEEIEKNQ